MAKLIKIKCNGAQAHVNEVDLDSALKREVVLRGSSPLALPAPDLPDRLVLKCRHCAEGRIVLTRAMIEKALGS